MQIAALVANEAPTPIPIEYSDFVNVFSLKLTLELPEHIGINDYAIKLVDDWQPPYGPIYSLEPVELETLKTYIETNLKNGFIRPSKSPAGAPILFDKKPDGSLRLCVDYRGLNNLTIKNQYPLPLVGESLDWLGRARRFIQLDLTSAYHRMRIRERDEWKTAFRTRYGHFEYQVMPFGLTNAPATFQGYINKILAEKLDVFVIVYLDDILIYTEDESEGHVQAVQWVLNQLRKFLLYANLKKCWFHQEEVWFLGYIVSLQGICMEDEKIRAVEQWLEPKSVRDIQVFLGFANFYWRFIQSFSCIATPLTSMLKTTGSTGSAANPKEIKGEVGGDSMVDNSIVRGGKATNPIKGKNQAKTTKSKILVKSKNYDFPKSRTEKAGTGFFNPKTRLAFTQLRQAFVKAPIFHHFDPESHIRIKTDVLGYAIGDILSQLSSGTRPDRVVTKNDLGQWHLVAFFSRKMISLETWYETYNGELLAIVKAFKT